jgi:putative transposase
MTKGLKRIYGRRHLHFLTFSCFKRLPLLETVQARNLFVEELRKVRERYGFLLVGYVVMPEHVHLLIGEPKEGTPSTVMQMLKQRVSRKMRKNKRGVSKAQLLLISSQEGVELSRFWQPRFYDFNVYSPNKKREKLEYMHGNPVKRGLVKNPGSWMWSSFLFYEKGEAGLVPIDPVE